MGNDHKEMIGKLWLPGERTKACSRVSEARVQSRQADWGRKVANGGLRGTVHLQLGTMYTVNFI